MAISYSTVSVVQPSLMSSTTLYARQEHNRNSLLFLFSFLLLLLGVMELYLIFFSQIFFHKYLVALWSDNLEIHWRLFFCWGDDKGSLCTADLLLNSPTVYFLMAAYKAQLRCLTAAVSPWFFLLQIKHLFHFFIPTWDASRQEPTRTAAFPSIHHHRHRVSAQMCGCVSQLNISFCCNWAPSHSVCVCKYVI